MACSFVSRSVWVLCLGEADVADMVDSIDVRDGSIHGGFVCFGVAGR